MFDLPVPSYIFILGLSSQRELEVSRRKFARRDDEYVDLRVTLGLTSGPLYRDKNKILKVQSSVIVLYRNDLSVERKAAIT